MDEDATLDGSESLSLYMAGRDAHPEVELPYPRFATAAERAATSDGPRAAHGADFFLATACDAGVDAAWTRLEATALTSIRPILHARRIRPDHVRDVVMTLPGFLAAPSPRQAGSTRIGTYAGLSKLTSWVAVVAMRRAADLLRDADDGATLPPLPDPRRSPLQELTDRESIALFAEALRTALEQLTPRERLAVLLRHRDGLQQREIALLMGVGPPRVSQLLRAATERLRSTLREVLADTAPTEHESLWSGLREEIRKALATSDGPFD